MTTIKKLDRRAILSVDPKSFNELLDFFEYCAVAIIEPLEKACDLIKDELNYHRGDIFGYICNVSNTSLDLVKHLKKIRAARNAGTDVAITLTGSDARISKYALEDIARLLSDTETALQLVENNLKADDDDKHYKALAVISLSQRALSAAGGYEATTLHKLAATIKEAGKYQQIEEEEAA